jgi:hypothetical protein
MKTQKERKKMKRNNKTRKKRVEKNFTPEEEEKIVMLGKATRLFIGPKFHKHRYAS